MGKGVEEKTERAGLMMGYTAFCLVNLCSPLEYRYVHLQSHICLCVCSLTLQTNKNVLRSHYRALSLTSAYHATKNIL